MFELFYCLLEVEVGFGDVHRLKYSCESLKKYTIVLNLHCWEGEGGSYSNILQLEPPLSSTLLILHLTTSTTSSLSTGGREGCLVSLYNETKYSPFKTRFKQLPFYLVDECDACWWWCGVGLGRHIWLLPLHLS